VSKLRVAGAELKEAFLPVDSIWASFSITENLSIEGVYLLEWEEIEPDPAGTYFSTNDFASIGGTYVAPGCGVLVEVGDGVLEGIPVGVIVMMGVTEVVGEAPASVGVGITVGEAVGVALGLRGATAVPVAVKPGVADGPMVGGGGSKLGVGVAVTKAIKVGPAAGNSPPVWGVTNKLASSVANCSITSRLTGAKRMISES
jgi:hypothetical protein